jgi:integrase
MQVGYVRVSTTDQNLDLQLDALEKGGIKRANLHSLRKTFGSNLLQEGIDIFMVSKLLGHHSVQTTQKYYVDYLDENYRSAINRLDK